MTTETPSKPDSQKTLHYVLAGIAALTLGILGEVVDHFGYNQYFWIGGISLMALSFAIWENRSFHKEFWFGFVLVVFFVFHAFLVLIVGQRHWLDSIGHGTGRGVAVVALLDAGVMSGFIRFPDWITHILESHFGVSNEGTAAK